MVEVRCTNTACRSLYTLAVDAVVQAWASGDQFGALALLTGVVEPLARAMPPPDDLASPADLWNHITRRE